MNMRGFDGFLKCYVVSNVMTTHYKHFFIAY